MGIKLPTQKQIEELLNAYSWEKGESKNPWMTSFFNEDKRMNIYYTTMTITVDIPGEKTKVFRNVETLEDLEKILI